MEIFIRLSFGLIEHNEVQGFQVLSSFVGQIVNNNEYFSYFPMIGVVDISLYGVTSVAPVLREKIFTHIYFLNL